MKTTILCLLLSAFFVSCQSGTSQNAAKEDIWKKNTSEGLRPAASTADATNAPIDGGLSILLLAGVGYGAKRLRREKKA